MPLEPWHVRLTPEDRYAVLVLLAASTAAEAEARLRGVGVRAAEVKPSPRTQAKPPPPDAAAPLREGGYGDALPPETVYAPQHEGSPTAGLWVVRSVRYGEPVEIIDRPSARMPEHRFSRFLWIEPPGPEPRPAVPFVLLTDAETWQGNLAARMVG